MLDPSDPDRPPRVVIVPRWGGKSSDDWYPWLRGELLATFGAGLEVDVLDLPDPDTPRIETWAPALAPTLSSSDGPVFLIGHSVGCQACLHALAGLEHARVWRLLCVAGWWTVDDPWASILPWMQAPLDLGRVREHCDEIHVLLSTNDPFTADHRRNASLWQERLGARVTVVQGARHFNRSSEPDVLRSVRALLAARRGG